MFSVTARARRKMIALVSVAALSLAITACGGATGGSVAPNLTSLSTIPDSDPFVLKAMAAKVLNTELDVNALAPELQRVLMGGSVPLTAEQHEVFEDCMTKTECETGQGAYTLALMSDLDHSYWSQARAEMTSFAIKSGKISRIIYMDSGPDLQRHLMNWRIAIAQGVDIIVPWLNTVGNQVGPVVKQAVAAGIAVVNGINLPAAAVAEQLSGRIKLGLCGMWESAAPRLKEHLQKKGSDLTYAMFTGIPGNAYAPTWQPCAKDALDAAGFRQVYEGTTDWSPQGTVQAASALRASGKAPGLIAYDESATDFINAYTAAGDKGVPTIALSGSTTLGTLQAVERARLGGFDADVFLMSGQAWINAAAVAVGIQIKDGFEPSSDLIVYPMGIASADEAIKQLDLSLPEAALNGVLLDPADQVAVLNN
ncbi:hypothetical protein EEB12_28975 [Rhodococcus sp. WS1]|uniref:sugar ABC transporter substrate-binding protein n=1 Tax=unclassified Rhodococcus (in: high G+C Gram-positive bacteria) TaxID=192944 RepID=UPI00114235B2|nr:MULTISPECIES: substrate-binding domain-containing protein [unclassified Rhodococcus (in: high G+C Gram-positive bacteria)]ROZ52871.1 hypothetical protein EEB12_28975 [Rhodococcus sp. WS1]TQC35963.1 hypothetical protein EEB16_20590 [Rhodococcus sp. WS7]